MTAPRAGRRCCCGFKSSLFPLTEPVFCVPEVPFELRAQLLFITGLDGDTVSETDHNNAARFDIINIII